MGNILKFKPFDATYPHNAHAISILTTAPEYYPWLLNSFIQIEGWDNENMDFEDFWILECPLLGHQRISKKLILEKWDNYLNFMIEMIECGYYIYLVIDTGKIAIYKSTGYPHDMLIYGYDESGFYVADFFHVAGYGKGKVTYDEMQEALKLRQEYEEHWIFNYDIVLLWVKEGNNAVFSPERVRISLEDYLSGNRTKYWYHRSQKCYVTHQYELVYGADVYGIMYNHIDMPMKTGELLEHWRQGFHLWYEHKSWMRQRLVYMQKNFFLMNADSYIKGYAEIEQGSRILMALCIKYYLTRNQDILERMRVKLQEIEMAEKRIIPLIIEDIIVEGESGQRGLVW